MYSVSQAESEPVVYRSAWFSSATGKGGSTSDESKSRERSISSEVDCSQGAGSAPSSGS